MTKTLKLFLCMTIISTTACTLDEPTWVNPSRVEVHEEGFTDNFDTSSLDQGTLRAIGANYDRYGNGPMDVAVSYDPKSKTNTEAKAKTELRKIQAELQRNGVSDIRASVTPGENTGEKSSTMVSFPALTARAPRNCGLMPGYTDAQTGTPEDAEGEHKGYAIGCTVESLMAKQIARPGDLLGRPGFETNADALRQERVIWKRGYYSDRSNPPLEGEAASDD